MVKQTEDTEPMVRVRRVVVAEYECPIDAYPDMTAEQIRAYETEDVASEDIAEEFEEISVKVEIDGHPQPETLIDPKTLDDGELVRVRVKGTTEVEHLAQVYRKAYAHDVPWLILFGTGPAGAVEDWDILERVQVVPK